MTLSLCGSALLFLSALGLPASVPQDVKDLSAPLAELRARCGAPGIVALALQDGEVVAFGVAGERASGGGDPLRRDDPMHLGSCTKAMTATLAARLVEQGKLTWSTTVDEALPSLADGMDPGFRAVTLLDLLRHRGGIAERRRPEIALLHATFPTLAGTSTEVRRSFLAEVLAQPPLLPAPNGFDYSNYGYMTAAAMMEAVTGRSWAELLRTEVFEPLGMASARIGSPIASDREGCAVGHEPAGEEAWKPLPPGPAGILPDAMAPAGLVSMSLADWGKFVAVHLAGARGEGDFLRPETIATLHGDPHGSGYAAGWGTAHHVWSWGEGDVLTHNGSDSTWFSLVFAMPEWDLVVLAASNCGEAPGEQATSGAKDLLLEALDFAR